MCFSRSTKLRTSFWEVDRSTPHFAEFISIMSWENLSRAIKLNSLNTSNFQQSIFYSVDTSLTSTIPLLNGSDWWLTKWKLYFWCSSRTGKEISWSSVSFLTRNQKPEHIKSKWEGVHFSSHFWSLARIRWIPFHHVINVVSFSISYSCTQAR
jgi:hypothetical protein